MLSSRQPGLSQVFDELVGFDKNGFYFAPIPKDVAGCTFKDACLRFHGAVMIGICRDNSININPGVDYILDEEDALILVAESLTSFKVLDQPFHLSASKKMTTIQSEATVGVLRRQGEQDKILVCGWRRNFSAIIMMLNSLVKHKSTVHILCEMSLQDRHKLLTDDGLDLNTIDMLDIEHYHGNPATRRHLEQLEIEAYSSVMIVADVNRDNNVMASDSHSLASLLLIRNIQKQRLGEHGNSKHRECTVMCEFLDSCSSFMKNRDNKRGEHVDNKAGFVQSYEIISRVMALVAGRPKVKMILDELLGYHGASLRIEKSSRYVRKREMVSFWTVAQRAWDMNEILIGRCNINAGIIEINTRDKELVGSWDSFCVICIAGARKEKGKEAKLGVLPQLSGIPGPPLPLD